MIISSVFSCLVCLSYHDGCREDTLLSVDHRQSADNRRKLSFEDALAATLVIILSTKYNVIYITFFQPITFCFLLKPFWFTYRFCVWSWPHYYESYLPFSSAPWCSNFLPFAFCTNQRQYSLSLLAPSHSTANIFPTTVGPNLSRIEYLIISTSYQQNVK